ncbi:DDE-type integrase/transposase/recombinase [Streptomyces kronopolitis]
MIRAKSPCTTRPAPEDRPADLVERQFATNAPNQLWVADITYINTFSGWVYAAFVIDVFSRIVLGWQVATSLYIDLVLDALEMVIWRRQQTGADLVGPTHHSDRSNLGGSNWSPQHLDYGRVRWGEPRSRRCRRRLRGRNGSGRRIGARMIRCSLSIAMPPQHLVSTSTA